MVVDVLHPGKANVSKNEICEKLAKTYKSDVQVGSKIESIYMYRTLLLLDLELLLEVENQLDLH